jgi:hypothetical protein
MDGIYAVGIASRARGQVHTGLERAGMRCLDKVPTARWINMSSKCTFVSAPKGVCLGQAFCSEDTVADGMRAANEDPYGDACKEEWRKQCKERQEKAVRSEERSLL